MTTPTRMLAFLCAVEECPGYHDALRQSGTRCDQQAARKEQKRYEMEQTEHMTLAELKEILSTYGVNEEERNAAVFVTVNGTPIPLSGGMVDYGNHPAATEGRVLVVRGPVPDLVAHTL